MVYTVIALNLWIVFPSSLLLCFLAASCAALLHRRVLQRRRAQALLIQSEDGIAYEEFLPVGGIPQWISVRGENRENPVLLVIHGGPGASCSIFTPVIRSWERYFTVIQWDQRGSGKTLRRNGPKETGDLSFERLCRDGLELAELLRRRLRKEKIVLLACSLGSTFGLQMVRRRPELFSAYIGTDQNVGMIRHHADNYASVIDRLRALRLHRGASALSAIGANPSPWTAEDFDTVARWTMRSDPESYPSIINLLKSSIWYSPSHTLRDIRAFVQGMKLSRERLMPDIRIYDAWQCGTRFELPFFVFQGERDVITPYTSAKDFFDSVIAPVKQWVTIRDAGHFAAFLEPRQFLHALLTHVRPLAIAREEGKSHLVG